MPIDTAHELANLTVKLNAHAATVEVLNQHHRDAALQFDSMFRRVVDLEQTVARLEAVQQQRSHGANCPGCGSLYRGAKAVGQRVCPKGCGHGTF